MFCTQTKYLFLGCVKLIEKKIHTNNNSLIQITTNMLGKFLFFKYTLKDGKLHSKSKAEFENGIISYKYFDKITPFIEKSKKKINIF
jgi:hypothetical protein